MTRTILEELTEYTITRSIYRITHLIIDRWRASDQDPIDAVMVADIDPINTETGELLPRRSFNEATFLQNNHQTIYDQFRNFLTYRRFGGGPTGTYPWHTILRNYGPAWAADMHENGRTIYAWTHLIDQASPTNIDADHLSMDIRVFALDDQGLPISYVTPEGVTRTRSVSFDGRSQVNGTDIMIASERTAIGQWAQVTVEEAYLKLLGITL